MLREVTTLYSVLLLTLAHGQQQTFTAGQLQLERHGEKLLLFVDGNYVSKSSSSSLRSDTHVEDCSVGEDNICLRWASGHRHSKLQITKDKYGCIAFLNDDDDPNAEITYCSSYGEDQWYGGSERWQQEWPVQTLKLNKEPFVVRTENAQEIAEPYWLSSSGHMFYVDYYVPLFVDSNNRENGSLCFVSQNSPPYNPRNNTVLDFLSCQFLDPVEAHLWTVKNNLGKPTGTADETMIRSPIFSTWARYKQNINQEVVSNFFTEIKDHQFNISQIEIDDKWETCYGSATFDSSKFPSIWNLTNLIHEAGARVTLWVHPFINDDCEPHFTQALNDGRFVRNAEGEVLVNWWNGNAGAVDFTNETTVQWWTSRLRQLIQTAGIDSFKFDAGETSYLPINPILNVSHVRYPDEYTKKYVETAASFGSFIETRVGKYTQSLPIFVREADKDTRWNISNGLQAVITTMLQMNMVGYSYVLPDMVGGNAYGDDKVSKELFIRWLQANTFMPSIQFSVVPWDFDEETIEISRKFTALHQEYADTILNAGRKLSEDGTPINPPIWWVSPNDTVAHAIRDEFMLGKAVLVAPVVEEGARQRDVYLPAGGWQERTRSPGRTFTGPTWLRNYTAALDELPHFIKL